MAVAGRSRQQSKSPNSANSRQPSPADYRDLMTAGGAKDTIVLSLGRDGPTRTFSGRLGRWSRPRVIRVIRGVGANATGVFTVADHAQYGRQR